MFRSWDIIEFLYFKLSHQPQKLLHHDLECIFWIINNFFFKRDRLVDIVIGRKFKENFRERKTVKIQLLFNLPTYHNQKPIMISLWFLTLLKVCTKTFKNSKHGLLKSCQITSNYDFIKVIKGPGTSFQSSQ